MMKLKIDKIQELIDGIDYPEKPYWRFVNKNEDGLYTWIGNLSSKQFYLAQEIVDNIIPYYFNNVSKKNIENIFELVLYDSLEDRSYGYHLGIPYYKVLSIDTIFDKWLTSHLRDIKYIQDKINTKKEDIARYNIEALNAKPCGYFKPESYEGLIKISEAELLELQEAEKEKHNYIQEHTDKYKASIIQKYDIIANQFELAQQEKIDEAQKHKQAYIKNDAVADFVCFILKDSFYPFEFDCSPKIAYNKDNKLLVVDYYLPTIDEIPNIKEIKEYKTKGDEIKYLSNTELNRLYDELIYKILIRSIAEIFHFDDLKKVDVVCFNGRVKSRNPATGQLMDNCILSVQISWQEFESIDLNYVDCKACFKHFKGVSGAKLHDMSPIVPLIQLDTTDKRFVESHSVATDESTNLATMDWEEFEHLVRELFDLEFNVNGGEVKITQASRDGGVDAVAFDPDPIRGGKIVIQAKRYTNTVGVSAVRDLYGTVINEGANKGILITTSDYGADSYNFAKGKPLTLLNGGHLLFLLEKHNKKARIDLKEAKEQ